MTGYADPELLLSEWLRDELHIKTWADPALQANAWTHAPIAHIQRGQGFGATPLTLDDVTLDIDVIAHNADHARETAARIWTAMEFQLPRTTLPGGVFVKHVETTMKPIWGPADPKVFRRSAAYRVILHGLVST